MHLNDLGVGINKPNPKVVDLEIIKVISTINEIEVKKKTGMNQ